MSFRYGYTATMKGQGGMDADGYPTLGTEVSFSCDYQPTSKDVSISTNAGIIPITYKLFVSPSNKTVFAIDSEVTCNGCKGIIALVFPTRLNTEIWVK